MSENLKYQIAGAVVGGGLGYIVGSMICDRWFPEYEEVEVDEVITFEKLDRFERAAKRLRKTKPVRRGDGVVDYNRISKKPELSELEKMTAKYKLAEEAVSELDTPSEFIEEVADPDMPFVISSDMFDAIEGYDMHTLHYYVLDDTCTDEEEVLVKDVENLIGDDALNCFGQDSGDADVVYVRNPKLRCDYEIIRLHKSYTVDVLHLKPATKVKKQNVFAKDEED